MYRIILPGTRQMAGLVSHYGIVADYIGRGIAVEFSTIADVCDFVDAFLGPDFKAHVQKWVRFQYTWMGWGLDGRPLGAWEDVAVATPAFMRENRSTGRILSD